MGKVLPYANFILAGTTLALLLWTRNRYALYREDASRVQYNLHKAVFKLQFPGIRSGGSALAQEGRVQGLRGSVVMARGTGLEDMYGNGGYSGGGLLGMRK